MEVPKTDRRIAQARRLFDDDVVAGHRYGAASKRPNFRQHLERRSESGDLGEDLLGSADHLSVLDVVSGLVPREDQSPVLARSARQVCAQEQTARPPPTIRPARSARRCRHRRVTAKYLPSMFPMAYGPAPVTAPGGRSATGQTVICFAMPASSQPPTVLGTSLSTCPLAHAGKTPSAPLVTHSFTSADDRELR